jgi:hypothetical protein
MPITPGLVPEVTINGTFGELRLNGTWLVNVQQVDGRIQIDRHEMRMAGKRAYGYKMTGIQCTGTIRQFKVTSELFKLITNPFRGPRLPMSVVSLIVKLDDVEALGVERVALENVKFWEINFGYQVNDIVEESIPFTAEGLSFLDEIVGDPTRPATGRT